MVSRTALSPNTVRNALRLLSVERSPHGLSRMGALYGTSVAYGVGLGVWVGAELGIDDPATFLIFPAVLGVAAPAGVYALDRPFNRGVPSAIAAGMLIGAGEGIGIASYQFVTADSDDAWASAGLARYRDRRHRGRCGRRRARLPSGAVSTPQPVRDQRPWPKAPLSVPYSAMARPSRDRLRTRQRQRFARRFDRLQRRPPSSRPDCRTPLRPELHVARVDVGRRRCGLRAVAARIPWSTRVRAGRRPSALLCSAAPPRCSASAAGALFTFRTSDASGPSDTNGSPHGHRTDGADRRDGRVAGRRSATARDRSSGAVARGVCRVAPSESAWLHPPPRPFSNKPQIL